MGRSRRVLTRIMLPLSFAGGISLAATAGTSCQALAQDVDEREEAIRGVIAAWHEAEERLDVDRVRELITADYFHVTSHGEVLDVSDLLGGMEWMREHRVTRRYERGPVTVLIHGTSAAAHYPFEYRDGGSPLEGKYVNTLVLVEESGAWKIASSHSSRVDPLAFVEVLELGTWPVVTLTPEARALYVGGSASWSRGDRCGGTSWCAKERCWRAVSAASRTARRICGVGRRRPHNDRPAPHRILSPVESAALIVR